MIDKITTSAIWQLIFNDQSSWLFVLYGQFISIKSFYVLYYTDSSNQGFLIIICVAIYAVLVQNMIVDTNISTAIWSCMGYTVLLCFTLFKTGSLAKSLFNSH